MYIQLMKLVFFEYSWKGRTKKDHFKKIKKKG